MDRDEAEQATPHNGTGAARPRISPTGIGADQFGHFSYRCADVHDFSAKVPDVKTC